MPNVNAPHGRHASRRSDHSVTPASPLVHPFRNRRLLNAFTARIANTSTLRYGGVGAGMAALCVVRTYEAMGDKVGRPTAARRDTLAQSGATGTTSSRAG